MKPKTPIFCLKILILIFFSSPIFSQVIDFRKEQHTIEGAQGSGGTAGQQFEWLNSGRFGFNGDLSVQATAQILRFRIGEPDGFNLPLYILTTANGESLDETSAEQLTLNRILNPTAGLFNALVTDSYRLAGKKGKKSSLAFTFGSGYKLINGKSEKLDTTINISTFYGDLGLRFVTGAWVDGSNDKTGTFGVQFKMFGTTPLNEKKPLNEIFGPEVGSWFIGISADIVLYVSEAVDLRLNYSRSLTQEKIDENDLTRTVVNFSVNYSL